MTCAMDLDALAAIAADPDAPVRTRVEALVAVVEQVSRRRVDPPAALADALDDLALVDAAVAQKRAGAVCAALVQLGEAPELATMRKRIVRRLVAAGATGLPLAGLAIAVGDVGPGANLAVRELATHVVPLVTRLPPHRLVDATIRWLAEQPDTAIAAILGKLDVNIDALLAHGTNSEAVARVRALARSILAP
jgi:hypothetical protein